MTQEESRLEQARKRTAHWKRWGPYLSERQWGTVREDYSADGAAWEYFPHDHARSRAYRWGEDGLAGISDNHQRLCFALALWNGRDPILKERLFGLTNHEGNHGEDVKEYYFYLDATPTHAYMKYLYKYPQAPFPYAALAEENRRRGRGASEYELLDTGVFDQDRYFDVVVEYAKATTDDVLIRVIATNRGPDAAELHLLPTLWFRNTWAWGLGGARPGLRAGAPIPGSSVIEADLESLGRRWLYCAGSPALLFTENETNYQRLFGVPSPTPFVKDGIDDFVVHSRPEAVNPEQVGTKAAARYRFAIGSGESVTLRLRLTDARPGGGLFGTMFDDVFTRRIQEADEFYATVIPTTRSADTKGIVRQALAGLLWNEQFYHYDVKRWLTGDPAGPSPPPPQRWQGRNREWTHLYNEDVISMPDKWEYPWYAAWDLAFHCIPLALVDPDFAKAQLILLLREWYMHPNGQLPAYEWAYGDVNPPVHAWAAWRVYTIHRQRSGRADRAFLERVFHKLLLNFTWWVNRKDPLGLNVFQGGFLGLDNIGVFDRGRPLPTGGVLEQADGTAWMACYCATMLAIALELASGDPAYEDVASKFFEHFVAITHAMNTLGGTGLWDEQDGFYYDQIQRDGGGEKLRIRSLVGLIPLLAVEVLDDELIQRLSGFKKRMDWFLEHRPDLNQHISYCCLLENGAGHCRRLLAIPSRERLERVLRYLLDENEFLSPYGIRSVSRIHKDRPYIFRVNGEEHRVDYGPGESTTGLFGGNSNWRGPIWFPINYLLIEALERYHHFYGDSLQVECPTGSGRLMSLDSVARELATRLTRIFLPDATGARPCHGGDPRYRDDPHWRELILFHEYFHAETGRGVGASHQTGWTALVVRLIEDLARS